MSIRLLKLLGIFFVYWLFAGMLTAQELHSPAVFQTRDLKGDLVTCGLESGGWLPGQLNRKNTFISLNATLAKHRRSLKKAKTSKSKLALQKKIKRMRSVLKLYNHICAQGPHFTPTPTASAPSAQGTPGLTPTLSPTPTLAPGQTPQPTPTPTRTATPSGPFDANGNTSSFGIPAGYSGNIGVGDGLWNLNCKDCHTIERRNSSYQQLLGAVNNVSQMRGFRSILSTQDLADLTAYLNRP